MAMAIAITRRVGASFAKAVRTFIERVPIDVRVARNQHHGYEAALRTLGLTVESQPPVDDLPDSIFVEDTAVVLEDIAVLTRPGIESRRGETSHMTRALAPYRRLTFINAPGTLDGGDVVHIGRKLLVGVGQRTNEAGVTQLAELVAPHGYEVETIKAEGALHLKSAATYIGDDTMVANPNWIDINALGAKRVLCVARHEPFGANVLAINGKVLVSDSYPETRSIIEKAGFRTQAVTVSELHKAEAGVTCMSVIFDVAKV